MHEPRPACFGHSSIQAALVSTFSGLLWCATLTANELGLVLVANPASVCIVGRVFGAIPGVVLRPVIGLFVLCIVVLSAPLVLDKGHRSSFLHLNARHFFHPTPFKVLLCQVYVCQDPAHDICEHAIFGIASHTYFFQSFRPSPRMGRISSTRSAQTLDPQPSSSLLYWVKENARKMHRITFLVVLMEL